MSLVYRKLFQNCITKTVVHFCKVRYYNYELIIEDNLFILSAPSELYLRLTLDSKLRQKSHVFTLKKLFKH